LGNAHNLASFGGKGVVLILTYPLAKKKSTVFLLIYNKFTKM